MKDKIWPLTVVSDRYGGSYSGGNFTAWNIESDLVPSAIHADDITVHEFWENNYRLVGIGDTIDDAIDDLVRKVDEYDSRNKEGAK